jgi:prefoldin subunit 5
MAYEIEQAISSLSKTVEDLTYRIYTLEDSIANINAYIEEDKEESIDA